jgi:predicted flavoprotein YhiN
MWILMEDSETFGRKCSYMAGHGRRNLTDLEPIDTFGIVSLAIPTVTTLIAIGRHLTG